MHEVVLHDPSLVRHAGQFVWLALNYDSTDAGPIIEKYQAQSIPALLVVDAASETVLARSLATATAAQVNELLDGAVRKVQPGAAAQAMAEADRLMGKQELGPAAKAYRRAVDASKPGEPLQARAIAAMIMALEESGQTESCARAFVELGPRMRRDSQFASAAFISSVCLGGAEKAAWADELEPAMATLFEKALRVPEVPFDQRSILFLAVAGFHDRRGDEAGARALRLEILGRLVDAWKGARRPVERVALAGFWPWLGKLVGQPERAIAPLQQCERESPDEYQCSLQLARAYAAVDRLDEAQAASERGRAKAKGPESRFWIASIQTSILIKRGDLAAARSMLDEAARAMGANPPDRVRASIAGLRSELGVDGRSDPPHVDN